MDSGLGIGGLSLSKDEVASSSFDLFSGIEIENSIQKANKIVVRPIAATGSKGPFKFFFPADPTKWTDCETIRLSGKVTLKKNRAGVLSDFSDAENEISTVNNFFQSLFSSIDCTINGVEITDPSKNWYPYKAYLETLLSYSKSTKEGRLRSHCFIKDTPQKYDSIATINQDNQRTADSDNDGYKLRRDFFHNSKTRYFNIPLHVDICTLRKYLPPNTALELTFHRSPDAFSLLSPFSTEQCEILIEDVMLSLTRYTPSPQIKNFHSNKLSSLKRQLLPIDRTLIKTYT